MRIRYLSSDVCSSDLRPGARRDAATLYAWRGSMTRVLMTFPADAVLAGTINQPLPARTAPVAWRHLDRKSVVYGKSVPERVDLGGRRIIKKKNKHQKHKKQHYNK